MTYEMFKKKIKAMGLVYYSNWFGVYIYYSNENHHLILIASIAVDKLYKMTTPSIKSDKLFKLCYELSRTPLNKRGELK